MHFWSALYKQNKNMQMARLVLSIQKIKLFGHKWLPINLIIKTLSYQLNYHKKNPFISFKNIWNFWSAPKKQKTKQTCKL